MPFPFLPNAKPRNLKFRIANTLAVRLFSRLTVSFSLSSRYFVLLSKSLSDAHLLFMFLTSSFLRIPSRDGHPCCSAIHFPLPGHVQDFHLRERAHGAQTKRAPLGAPSKSVGLFEVRRFCVFCMINKKSRKK